MEDTENSMYEAIFGILRNVVEERSNQVFGERLRSKSPVISQWKRDPPIMSGNKEIYPLGRFRFIQQLEFEGIQYPLIFMQDQNILDIVGLQVGMIVDSPIPRGLVILPKDIVPLELEKEQKRTYMNPLYALLRRERENEGKSTFMKNIKKLSDGYEMKEDVSTSLVTQVVLGKFGSEAKIIMKYPNYVTMYPVGNRTVVVTSTGVPNRDFVSAKLQTPNGKTTKIALSVPSEKILEILVSIMTDSVRIIESVQCDYTVQSKEPNLIPMFKYLTRIAAQDDIVYDLNNSYELLQENFAITSRELDLLHTGKIAGIWEISGLPSIRGSLNSRYATLTIKCPKCDASYNYSHTKIPEDGTIRCNNCLNEFQGVDLGPNY